MGVVVFHTVGNQLSRGATAYQCIKQEIITLRFAPGQQLTEAWVCALLQLGRTPVHHAFHRLSLEGLVQIIPRKGIMVTPLSLDEVMNLIEVRCLNEPHAARLAAQRATDEELDELELMLETTSIRTAPRDADALVDFDRRFHEKIAVATRNAVLGPLLSMLYDRSLRFWYISLSREGHIDEVLSEHFEIFTSLRQRDGERAAAMMTVHIESFRSTIARAIGTSTTLRNGSYFNLG